MQDWKTLSKSAARERADRWTNLSLMDFHRLETEWSRREVQDCPTEYLALRDRIVEAYDQISSLRVQGVYAKEWRFAIRLYDILTEAGMTVRAASDDGVWRFLSMVVCPDIVYDRWKDPKQEERINIDRFYFKTRRIWLKILWWYVYLCWQGSIDETGWLISTFNADDISQLVERAGNGGYRVDLFRSVIRHYGKLPLQMRARDKRLLSRVLQLNIARSQVMEPDLVEGGVDAYVRELFAYFGYRTEGTK